MPPSLTTDMVLKTGRPIQRLRAVLQAQEESNGIIVCWLRLSAHIPPKTYTYLSCRLPCASRAVFTIFAEFKQ